MLTSVLIPTRGNDPDATYVAAALRLKGHPAQLWMTADYPTCQGQSFNFDGQSVSARITSKLGDLDLRDVGTIWLRRPTWPYARMPGATEDDGKYLRATGRRYHMSLWSWLPESCLGDDVFWANPFESLYRAESKPLQLEIAARVGFRIPRTLISNDTDEVREFIFSVGSVIRKSLILFYWREEGRSFATMAGQISLADLEGEPDYLPFSDIYQEKIDKRAEIRTFVFGRTFFSVRLAPLPDDPDAVDFRVLHSLAGRAVLIDLPPDLKKKCLALMAELHVVTAVIEIMIDQAGDYVFTELNQGGQFLWITSHFPDCAILDAFSEFLAARDPCFDWQGPEEGILSVAAVAATDEYRELLDHEKIGLAPPPFWGV